MAEWLYDELATQAAGGALRFKLPYPRSNWREERTWNAFLLEAMRIVWIADDVFGTDSEKWNKQQRNFYMWMLNGLKAEKKAKEVEHA